MEDAEKLPSFRHFKMFEAVANCRSVSKASERIGLSQPALSQAIAKIEARFGVPLFERRHDGSYLTPPGQIVLNRAERMFGLASRGLEQLHGGAPSGEKTESASFIGKITPTHVRCLIAVSASSSFEEAARSIGVAQPSLHRAARDLERLLRRTLYTRGPKGMTASEQGRELARWLGLAIQEIDYAADEIAARQGTIHSQIAIGALSSLGPVVVGNAVTDLLREYPAARVRFVEEPYEQLLADLRRGDIDFLFGVLRRPAWATDVREQPLFDDPYVVVARRGHPLLSVKEVGREQLARYDWIVPGAVTPRYQAFERLFRTTRTKPVVRIETASRALIQTLLASSDQLTLLTRHEAIAQAATGALQIVPARVRLLHRKYGVATRVDWQPTALQQAFLRALVRHGRRAAAF